MSTFARTARVTRNQSASNIVAIDRDAVVFKKPLQPRTATSSGTSSKSASGASTPKEEVQDEGVRGKERVWWKATRTPCCGVTRGMGKECRCVVMVEMRK